MMEDPQGIADLRWNSESASVCSQRIAAKVVSIPKNLTQKSINHIDLKDRAIRGVAGDVAFFLLKVAALETTRRLSRAKCPFAWRSLQAFQMLLYPPFKWVRRWAPLKGLVHGMQKLSRPLLVLSIVTSFSEISDQADVSDDPHDSRLLENLNEDTSSVQPYVLQISNSWNSL